MKFTPVKLDLNLELCIQFRRDAHIISYGNDSNFDREGVITWFRKISTDHDAGFYLVSNNEQIIGLLEFKSSMVNEYDEKYGCIKLIYLTEAHRNQGFGEKLMEYMLKSFIENSCTKAYLRYVVTNQVGLAFYTKLGWEPVGKSKDNVQLMEIKLA